MSNFKKLLMCLLLFLMMGCQKEEIVVESEEYTEIGMGQASYVVANDASVNAYGQLEVHTVMAVVITDQDGIVEKAYFDESENIILFNNAGSIVSNGRVEEWPTKKEVDEEYTSNISSIEASFVGLSIEDCLLKLDDFATSEADVQMHKAALQNAYDKKERVDGMKSFSLGIVNRHLFEEALAEENGEAAINTTFVLLVLDENERALQIKLDEVYNAASFDASGMVLTSRFDTRSKVDKKEDYGLLPFSKLHVEYYKQIASLEEALIGKSSEEIEAYFKGEELLTHCSINTSDLVHALRKAYTSLMEI